MYTETKRSILGRRNTKTKKMHKEGLSKLAGAIAERRAIAEKIDELQIEDQISNQVKSGPIIAAGVSRNKLVQSASLFSVVASVPEANTCPSSPKSNLTDLSVPPALTSASVIFIAISEFSMVSSFVLYSYWFMGCDY